FGFARPELLPERGRRLFGMAMLPYLVLMFVNGLSNPTTDNWAHLGGLLTGAVLGLVLDPEPLQRRPHWNRTLQLGSLGLGALTLIAVAVLGPRLHPLDDHTRVGLGRARALQDSGRL